MSLADVHHEQEKHHCACVRLSPRDCIRARYPAMDPWDEAESDAHDERCECMCHDGEYEDDE